MRTADHELFTLVPLEDRLLLSATLLNAGATAMVYDAAGALHVAYYDTADHTLKYTARSATGAWDPAVTLDPTPYAGSELSIALDATGRPAVAYYDANNRDLKFAQKARRGWTIQTLDSAGTVGHTPSLAFTPDGFPLVSYYAGSTADLRLASFNGTRWYVSTIDSAGSVGRFSDLAISPLDGSWAIAYESQSDHAIRYAQKWGKSFTTRVIDTLPGGANWLAKPSLAFNSTGNPLVSYVDGDTLILNRAGRKSWSRSTIVDAGVTSPDTALFLQSDAPRLLYVQAGAFSAASMTPDGAWPTADLLVSVPLAVARSGDRINLLTASGAVTSIDPAAPSPLALAAERVGNLIHLAWNVAPAYAQQLTLERRSGDGSDFQEVADLSALDREYWDATDLTPGQTYVYRLRISGGTATAPFASTATLSFSVPAPTLTLAAQYGYQVDLTWAGVPADADLVIERAAAGSDDFQSVGTFYPGMTTYTDYVALGQAYVYRARFVVTDALASEWVILPVDTVLPAPNLALHVDEVAANHVTLSWTGLPAGALTAYIDRAQVGQSDFSLVATGGTYGDTPWTTWSDYDVTEGLAYVYRLRLVGERGASLPTDAATARADLPPVITGIIGVNWTAAGVYVSGFDFSAHELGYRIERSADDGAHFATVAELAEPDANGGYLDITAGERTTYVYRVTAVGQFAQSPPVDGSVTTGLRAPTAVTVTATSTTTLLYQSKSSVHLEWADNSSRETNYRILYSDDGVSFFRLADVSAGGTTYTHYVYLYPTLTPGRTYDFKVHALDDLGEEVPADDPAIRVTMPPAPPGPLYHGTSDVIPLGDAWGIHLHADLTAYVPAEGFRIERRVDDGPYEFIDRLSGSVLDFVDTFLVKPGHHYIYRVTPYNTTGGDGQANGLAVWTPPIAPVLKSVTSTGGSIIRVDWAQLPARANRIQVHYLSPFDGQDHVAGEIGTYSDYYNVSLYDNGQSLAGYTVKVWLTATVPDPQYPDALNPSSWVTTAPSNAILVQLAFGSPTGLTVTPVAPRTLDVSWAAVQGSRNIYTLAISTDGGNTYTTTGVAGTTYRLTGTLPGVPYTFKVVCAGVPNSYSAPVTAYAPPALPAHLVATSLPDCRVQLTWDDPTAGAAAYTLSFTRGNRATDPANVVQLPAGTISYTFDASLFEPGITYRFALGNTQFPSVPPLTVTHLAADPDNPLAPPAPAAPVLASGIALFRDLVKLAWETLPPDVESLEIAYRSPFDGQVHTLAAGMDPSLTSVRIGALENNQPFAGYAYTMWLVAVGPGGRTDSNTIVVNTSTGNLGLTVTPTGATSVQLTWADYANPTTYDLWYSTDGVSYAQYTTTTNTTMNLTGLQPDTVYWLKLRILNDGSSTSFAEPVTFLTTHTP